VDDQSPGAVVPIQHLDPRTPVQELPTAENPPGCHLRRDQEAPGPGLGARSHQKIAELLADERCSQVVPVSLATTDGGKTSGPVAEEGDGTASEASEWENMVRDEQLALLR